MVIAATYLLTGHGAVRGQVNAYRDYPSLYAAGNQDWYEVLRLYVYCAGRARRACCRGGIRRERNRAPDCAEDEVRTDVRRAADWRGAPGSIEPRAPYFAMRPAMWSWA